MIIIRLAEANAILLCKKKIQIQTSKLPIANFQRTWANNWNSPNMKMCHQEWELAIIPNFMIRLSETIYDKIIKKYNYIVLYAQNIFK
jgi:hypothetical protein